MTSDQKCQIEQLQSHAKILKTDIDAALSKNPQNPWLLDALESLNDVMREAITGILWK